MNENIFNPALWMPLAVFIVGVAVFVYGNARVQSAVRNAGVGIALLAVAWVVVARFVDTFSEKCVKRTDAIVAAVEGGKWDELTRLLDKNTLLADIRGAEAISATAEAAASVYQLKEIRIINHDVVFPFPNAVDVSIDTYNEGQQNSTTTWTFSYEQRTDGILLRQITPIRINGQSMQQFERAIGRFSR